MTALPSANPALVRGKPPIGEGDLKTIAITLTTLTLAAGATAASTATQQLHQAQTTVRFFQNHNWLRAPRQPNCQAVPWTQSCRIARRVYRRDLIALRQLKHQAWIEYHYNWRSWLPANWYRVGSCETGYGGPPDFTFANGSFVSAFGISRSIYDTDAAHAGVPPWNDQTPPTPRQQYLAAVAHYEMFGDGWGCPGP